MGNTGSVGDPTNFIMARKYFEDLNGWESPNDLVKIPDKPHTDIANADFWREITPKFKGSELHAIQSIRPTLWRVRFGPIVRGLNYYGSLQ